MSIFFSSSIKDLEHFYQLRRDAFKYKRKNIRNNLKNYNLVVVEKILKKYGFDLNTRAEQLNYKIFIEISNNLIKE